MKINSEYNDKLVILLDGILPMLKGSLYREIGDFRNNIQSKDSDSTEYVKVLSILKKEILKNDSKPNKKQTFFCDEKKDENKNPIYDIIDLISLILTQFNVQFNGIVG